MVNFENPRHGEQDVSRAVSCSSPQRTSAPACPPHAPPNAQALGRSGGRYRASLDSCRRKLWAGKAMPQACAGTWPPTSTRRIIKFELLYAEKP